eukprot:tig00000526_g1902.t1
MPPVASPSSSPPSSLPAARRPRNGRRRRRASRPARPASRLHLLGPAPVAIGEDGAGGVDAAGSAGAEPMEVDVAPAAAAAAARVRLEAHALVKPAVPGLPDPFNQRWRRRPLRDLVDAAARRAFCQAASTLAVRRPDGSQTACVYAGFLDFDAAGIAPSEKKGLAARAAPLRTLAELFAAEPRLLEPAGTAYRLAKACGAYPPAPGEAPLECLVTFSGLKGFHVLLRHPALLVRAPGARVKADGQVEPAAAGGGRAYSVDDLLETALVPLLRRLPGLSEEDVLGIVAAIDRSPLNPNCGLRLDEYPHPLTGRYPVAVSGPDLDALIEPDGEAAERVLIAGDGPAPEISAFLSGLFADLERRVGTEEAVAALPALPEAPSAPREGGGASRKRRRDGSPARGGAGSAPEALLRALELAPHHRDRRGAPRKVRLVGRSEDGRYVTFRVSPAAGSGARCHLGVEHDWRGTLCSVSQLLPGASMVAFRCGGQNHSDCARRPVFGRPVWDGARADPAEEAADDAALVALGECLSSIADGARGGGAAPPARTLPYPFSVVPRTNDRVYSVDAPCAECGGARGGVLVDVLAREVKAFPCAGCKAASPEGAPRALVARALEANGGPGIALFGAAGPKGWLEALPPLGGQAGEQLVAIIEVLRQRVVAKDWSGEPIRRGLVPEAARKALDALPLPDLREPLGRPAGGGFDWRDIVHDANDLGDPRRRWTGTGKSQAIVHLLAEMRKSPAAYGLPQHFRILYVVAGRIHDELLLADTRYTAICAVPWTSYKEMTPGQLAQASAQLMSTVESIQRLEGAFQEGRHSAAVARFRSLFAQAHRLVIADADLSQPDVDFYVGLFLGAGAAAAGARGAPEPFVVQYLHRLREHARAALLLPWMYAPLLVAAHLLAGKRVVLSADDRRALFATLALLHAHPALRARVEAGRLSSLFIYADAPDAEKEKLKEKALVGALDLFAYNSAVPQGSDFNEGGFDVCIVAMGGRTYDVNGAGQGMARVRSVAEPDVFVCAGREPREEAALGPLGATAARLVVLNWSRQRTVQALDAKFGKMGYARGLELVEKAEPLPKSVASLLNGLAARVRSAAIYTPVAAAATLGEEDPRTGAIVESMLAGRAPAALGRWPVTEAERLACRKRFVAGALRIDPADVSLAEVEAHAKETPASLRPLIRAFGAAAGPFLADRDGRGAVYGRHGGYGLLAGRVDKQHTRRSALALLALAAARAPAGPAARPPGALVVEKLSPLGLLDSFAPDAWPAADLARLAAAVERDRLFEHATRRDFVELFDLAKEPTLEVAVGKHFLRLLKRAAIWAGVPLKPAVFAGPPKRRQVGGRRVTQRAASRAGFVVDYLALAFVTCAHAKTEYASRRLFEASNPEPEAAAAAAEEEEEGEEEGAAPGGDGEEGEGAGEGRPAGGEETDVADGLDRASEGGDETAEADREAIEALLAGAAPGERAPLPPVTYPEPEEGAGARRWTRHGARLFFSAMNLTAVAMSAIVELGRPLPQRRPLRERAELHPSVWYGPAARALAAEPNELLGRLLGMGGGEEAIRAAAARVHAALLDSCDAEERAGAESEAEPRVTPAALEELLRALCERAAEAEARSAADPGVDEEDARWFVGRLAEAWRAGAGTRSDPASFTKKELNGIFKPKDPTSGEELPVTLRGLPNKVAVIKPGNSSGSGLGLVADWLERRGAPSLRIQLEWRARPKGKELTGIAAPPSCTRAPLNACGSLFPRARSRPFALQRARSNEAFACALSSERFPFRLRNMSSALSVASSLDMIDPALFGRDGALFSCGAPAPGGLDSARLPPVASILAAAPDAEKEKLMEKELVGALDLFAYNSAVPQGGDFNEGGFDVCVVAMGGRTYDVNAEKEKPKEKELVGALDLFAYNSAVPQGGDFNEGGFDVCVVAMGGRTYDVNAEKEKPKEKELVGALDLFAYNSDVPQGGDFNEGCFDFCIVAMGGRTYDVNAAGQSMARLGTPLLARSRPFALQRARSNEAFACALSSERFPFRLRNMSSALSVASSLDMIDPALFGRDGALFSCGAPAPGGLDSARLPPVASILAPPLVATPWLPPAAFEACKAPLPWPRVDADATAPAPAGPLQDPLAPLPPSPAAGTPSPAAPAGPPSALPVAVPAPARHVDLGPCAPLRRRRVVRCSVCRLTGHNKKTHDRDAP